MKKPLFFLLLTCALTVGAGAVINETTGKQLHVWSNDTNDYKAKVTAIDSITCIDKVRVWVNNVIAYEKEVEIIDSLTFEDFIEDPVNPEDTIQYEITRGKFSVGEGKQVYFSLGNLQYQASTQTWRFAEHQYDHIGAGNANIADDYDGWIDLFAWGTNPYADDTTSHLRSLTASEWDYLVYTRQIGREDNLSGHAVVNGVTGYIILPDDFVMPEGITFLGTVGAWYKKNKYTLSQWKRMEAAGAIFLPVTGRRENTKVEAPDSYGYYWSSTVDKDNKELAWNLELFADSAPGNAAQIYTVSSNIQLGYAVRLIEPLFIDTIPVNPDTIPVDTIPEPPTPIDCPEGAIPGLFSVAADKRVYFSKGNLQYVDSIWQFAEHQWDYFGKDQADDHRDLFGWGTGFEPNKVSTSSSDYDIFVDWGANPITNGGNKDHIWQTLTQKENKYLLFTRENADILFALGTVNGVKGLILLPDDWKLPEGATFNPSTTMGMVSEDYEYTNSKSTSFTHNTYTAEQWSVMESAGAVFLPAAGYRNGKTSTSSVGSTGYYWTPTTYTSQPSYANYLSFDSKSVNTASTYHRSYGRSVRLVQPEILPSDTVKERVRGKFSVGEDKQVYFAPGNLQYQASTKTWRFAEHQYDTIGVANANISDDYDGWIDLFGWGTGDKPTRTTKGWYYYYYCYHDWGMNPISCGEDTTTHHWRAIKYGEWQYLFKTRTNADDLAGHGIVNGLKGYILLPDDFEMPEGIRFNGKASSWTKNTYTLEEWEKMEYNGAIFLPLTGWREGTEVKKTKEYGHYWLGTLGNRVGSAYAVDFYETGSSYSGYTAKIEVCTELYAIPYASDGYAVRLIEPVVPEVIPPDPDPIPCPEGAVPGIFSVSETKKVYFSKGNLQYTGCNWRFAEHQWDTIGHDNEKLSGTVDLFGWGTGNRPYESSDNLSDYIGHYYGFGINPIENGGNKPNQWYTLSKEEWEYLFDKRPNCAKLRCQANVNGVNGYIFLPDDFVLPYGGRFFGDQGRWCANEYTIEEWARMENAGAVFLPAAGSRTGTEVSDLQVHGSYWSSTSDETYNTAAYFIFGQNIDVADNATIDNYQYVLSSHPTAAKSVRLVRPVSQSDTIPTIDPDTIPADTIPQAPVVKGFTCNDNGRQLVFAKGNLQYQGNSNTWRFAEHPWDTCGFDNAYMSPVTRKWVDLFGFMRADLPALSKAGDANYADSVNYSWAKCPIVNGEGYRWFPPGTSALDYIIDKRTNHAQLFSGATVNGIAGLIILPDEWVLPEGLTYVSAEEAGLQDKGSKYTGVSNIYAINTYSAEQWEQMEAAGAVFLPAAGYRHEYTVSYVQTEGNYWTSATLAGNQTHAYSMKFSNNSVILNYNVPRPGGLSVRMIRYLDDTIQSKPTTPEPKPASVTFTANEDSTQLLFAPANLQYIDGKYYFAQHQYDTLGNTNRTAGLVTTDGYVGSYAMDLFGWGTANNPLQMSDKSDDYQDFVSWGTVPIQNSTDTAWLTPSMPQFRYILRYRNYADKLFGGATVNGIHGLILLPDHFVVPEGVEFHSSTDPDMGFEHYDTHYRSTASASKLYLHNTYNLEQWAKMEAAGAVFLPAAGFRGGSGTNVQLHDVNEDGYYWTNSIRSNNPYSAYTLHLSPTIVHPESDEFREYGRSVRLVRKVK